MASPSSTGLEQPRRGLRWAAALLLAAIAALIALQAFAEGAAHLPPPLVLLALSGVLGTLLVGAAAGYAAFALSLLVVAGFQLRHPAASPAELALRANLIVAICTTQLFVFGYVATVRSVRRRIAEQQRRIEQRLSERAELTHALNVDLGRAVGELGRLLAPAAPALDALRAVQLELVATMGHARTHLQLNKESELEVASVLPDFRRRMARWLALLGLATASVTVVRVIAVGTGAVLPTCAVLAVNLIVLVGNERRPEWRPQLVVLLTVVTLFAITAASIHWGWHEPPPNLPFLATLAYSAILIDGAPAAVALVSVCLAMMGAAAYLGAAATPWGAQLIGYVAVWTVLLQLCWHRLEQRVMTALDLARERAAELRQLDRFRARIGCTLFHDVANPVQVIGMLLELASIDRRGDHVAGMRRFHARLAALVQAAFEVLEGDQQIAAERIASAPVAGMFVELRELFAFRLAAKEQTLDAQGDPQLNVLSVPELLRDSVLANLISNAIKFSPQGATIELRAARLGQQAEIVVRDRGPGWPEELLHKLAAGERLESTAGTAGEQGLGLGLTLASEHVRRMGGSLSLRRPADGGSEAAVRLPAG